MMERTRPAGGAAMRILIIALTILASLGLASAGPGPAAGAAGAGEGDGATEARGGALALEPAAGMVGEAAVVAADALSLREGPGLDATALATLPYGTPGTITDGPIPADGYTWYEFNTADYGVGWVAGEFLAPAVGGDGGFAPGDEVIVAADDLNLRDAPGVGGAILAALPLGMPLTIADAPVIADGYTWYLVSYAAQERAGWVAGEFLAGAGEVAVFDHGNAVAVAAEGLNLRDAPALDGAVIAQLAAGTGALIIGGPLAADGYTWYQIALDGSGGAGWAAGEFLARP